MGKDKKIIGSSELRRRAERQMKTTPADAEEVAGMSTKAMAKMIHELRVHQIELKMQNEELRRIQEALEETRDRYSHLYDFAPVGYLTVDEKGIVEGANLTFATLVGMERSAVLGKPFSGFIQREDQDVYYRHCRRLLASGDFQSFSVRCVKNDGSDFYTNLECMIIRQSASDLKQIRIVVSDITQQKELERQLQQAQKMEAITKLEKEIHERKEVERELKRNETMLKEVFDGILDPLILVDKHMTIMMMNRAGVEYYKAVNQQDVIGKTCHRELMGESDVCQGCTVSLAISSGRHISSERKGLMDPDRLENVVAYPIMEEDGSVASIITRISDITDKKLFERQLIKREKLASLGVMVSSMAHEINNPNSFISFNIPILRDYVHEMLPMIGAYANGKPEFELCNLTYPEFEQDITRLLLNIENGSKRISSVISNLREYSHDKSDTCRIWVDLTYVIGSVLSIIQSKISQSVKSFINNVPEKLPSIFVQPYAIEQILINFLINASQAVDKDDSWIKLEVTINGGDPKHVFIAVSDNGHGMDEKTQSKIFDPFFTTKSPQDGTGLGLFVSHTLAERMAGHIEVESEPGKGSKFVLILPIED